MAPRRPKRAPRRPERTPIWPQTNQKKHTSERCQEFKTDDVGLGERGASFSDAEDRRSIARPMLAFREELQVALADRGADEWAGKACGRQRGSDERLVYVRLACEAGAAKVRIALCFQAELATRAFRGRKKCLA